MPPDINRNDDQQLPPVSPQPAGTSMPPAVDPPPDDRDAIPTDSAVGMEHSRQETKPATQVEGGSSPRSVAAGDGNDSCAAAPVAPGSSAVPNSTSKPVAPAHSDINQPDNAAASNPTDANGLGGPETSSGGAEPQKSRRPAGRSGRRPWRRRTPHVPSRDQTLATLSALIPAMMLGKVAAQEAAAIRAIADTILRHLGSGAAHQDTGSRVDIDKLKDLAGLDPSIVDIFAHMLSDEQLQELLHEADADDDPDLNDDGSKDNPAAPVE